MDFLDQQPLDKLITNYIQLTQKSIPQSKYKHQSTTLLNSILVACYHLQDGLKEVMEQCQYVLEVNSQDRVCLRRVGRLLWEVVERGEVMVSKASLLTIRHVLEFGCKKALVTECCNQFIGLIGTLTTRLSQQKVGHVMEMLLQFVTSVKIEILTYGQEARLKLYQVILRGLELWSGIRQEWRNQQTQIFIHKCVRLGEGERDPRNIESIFQIYLHLADHFEDKLTEYRSEMFDNIEAYYPIQFIKDDENPSHQAIDLKSIARKLDQCICHPFFAEETWQLLTTKTAAPPISTFVPTLLDFLDRTAQSQRQDYLPRIKGMLLRFSEDEFMGQSFEESKVDLGTVIARLLSFLAQINAVPDGSISWGGYSAVLEWVRLMVGKATKGQYPHTGTLISIFRTVIDSCGRNLAEIVRSHTLRTVINALQPPQQLIPKLGLAIVCLSGMAAPSPSIQQIMGLLVIQVGSIYPSVPDQIRVLILKILLQVGQASPTSLTMVRRVNNGCVLGDYLSRAQQAIDSPLSPQQMYFVKAFIDFISIVYGNQRQKILSQIKGVNYQLQGYLLGRMWQGACREGAEQARKQVVDKYRVLLLKLQRRQEADGLMDGLKVIPERDVWQLICWMNWQPSSQRNAKMVLLLILTIRKHLKHAIDLGHIKPKSHLAGTVLNTILRQVEPNAQISPQEKLWRTFTAYTPNITFPTPAQLPYLDPLSFPFDPDLLPAYPPTLLHFLWHSLLLLSPSPHRDATLTTLLPLVPLKLLLRDSPHIASLLLKDTTPISSLVSVAKHLPVEAMTGSGGILRHCVGCLQEMAGSGGGGRVERSAGVVSILNEALQRDRKGEVRDMLAHHVPALRKLQLHRKRLVRQGARRLLDTLLNS